MKKRVFATALLAVLAFVAATYPTANADSGNIIINNSYEGGQSAKFASSSGLIQTIEAVPVIADNVYSYDNCMREMRGAWIATVKNTNMPSAMGEAAFRAWAEENISFLKNNGFNAVIFQIRPTGDALYKSELAPWSSFITGKDQGTNPGYDPLQIMIETAHGKGLELHAWINPYRISMPSDDINKLSSDNFAKKNPSYLVKYGSQYYLNPGEPAVSEHLVAVVSEVVKNYDIDAIHIDDYFYPYPVAGENYNDSAAYAKYGAGFANIGDWRRNNVTQLIRKLYSAIKDQKSYVQLGISPFGVWRNLSSDPTGSDTNAGHECYDSLYADTRTWIKEGIIDYITPQIYWSTELTAANYKTLLSWWKKEVDTYAVTHPVNLYIGMANYKVENNADLKWNDPNEINTQIALNRANDAVFGQMHYSINSLKENKLGHVDSMKNLYYKNIALTPALLGQGATNTSLPVTYFGGTRSDAGIVLTVSSSDVNTRKYVIYRFNGNSAGAFTDENILDVVYKTDKHNLVYFDSKTEIGKTYTYAVKSVSFNGTVNNSYKSFMVTR